MNKTVLEVLKFFGIFLFGALFSIYMAPLFTTDQVEFVALCLAICFHGALVYMGLKSKKE